jgi:hypothetical protein
MTMNPLYESYPVALYDMSIADVAERAKRRIVYPKAVMAANFLGYQPDHFYRLIGRGHYATKRGTGKKFAIRRLSKMEAK